MFHKFSNVDFVSGKHSSRAYSANPVPGTGDVCATVTEISSCW